MNRTRRSGHSPESYPRIFISHRHKDEDVGKVLVNLLEAAFHIEKGDIRCTSVQPYRLPAGARTPDRLRVEIRHAGVVLGILTPDTKESSYVLFELGASWGQNIPCFPSLRRGRTRRTYRLPWVICTPFNWQMRVTVSNSSMSYRLWWGSGVAKVSRYRSRRRSVTRDSELAGPSHLI
jgi:TIR domain